MGLETVPSHRACSRGQHPAPAHISKQLREPQAQRSPHRPRHTRQSPELTEVPYLHTFCHSAITQSITTQHPSSGLNQGGQQALGQGGPQASQPHQDPTGQWAKYPCQAHGLSFCHTEGRFTWHKCPHGMRATTCPRVPPHQTHQAASGPQLHMAVWPQSSISSTGAASLCPAASPRGASQHSAHRRDSSPAIPRGIWVF